LVRRVLELDFDEIRAWFEARELKIPDRSLFPKVGFIVEGVAAGFIYFTDSPVAIIDCYISNPLSDSKYRSEAITGITEALIVCAKFHKCKRIKCDSTLGSIKRRALDHGFKSTGTYESFIMEI